MNRVHFKNGRAPIAIKYVPTSRLNMLLGQKPDVQWVTLESPTGERLFIAREEILYVEMDIHGP